MNTRSLLFFALMFCSAFSSAQNVAINSTGNSADPSAILDISSSDKGVLIPRMQASDRVAIVAPAPGLLVFDTDSRTFWYYSNGWNEIGSGGISGVAGGDLAGLYPNPDVVRIQNHEVSTTLPANGQILKWYGPNNRWQPLRDSLALPYVAIDAHQNSLFSVTNSWNGLGFNTSILGRRIDPSGIPLKYSTAIWGDAYVGTGVFGSSNFHSGVSGASAQNHGVEGQTQSAQKAGVYGTSSSLTEAIGVLGEVNTAGTAVYGKAMHDQSIAGRFESTSATSIFPTLTAVNFGLGASAIFASGNLNNNNATVYVNTSNNGNGIYAYHDSVGVDNSAIRGIHIGQGQGVYAKSHRGDAGRMVVDNFFSDGNALHASTIGDGSAGVFIKNHLFGEMTGDPAVLIDNISRAPALKVKSTFSSATTPAIDVEYEGYGFGIEINSLKGGLRAVTDDESSFAVFGYNTAENATAIQGTANAFGSTAIHGNADGFFGVGILGTTSHPWGTGVKGVAATSSTGAVTGINSGGGPGVLAQNTAPFGYGIIASSGPEHGIAGKFESGNETSTISPAIWALIQSLSNGIEIYVVNEANANDALFINHQGDGNFAKFNNSDNSEITFANNGNITTSGSLTVKGNKGVIRNSSGSQLRYDTKTSSVLVSPDTGVGVIGTLNITFSSAFSNIPVVTIANVENVSGTVGQKLLATISGVTTTGCTITVINPYMASTGVFSAKWTVMAVGAE